MVEKFPWIFNLLGHLVILVGIKYNLFYLCRYRNEPVIWDCYHIAEKNGSDDYHQLNDRNAVVAKKNPESLEYMDNEKIGAMELIEIKEVNKNL